MFRPLVAVLVLILVGLPAPIRGQTMASDDPVLQAIWDEGVDRSQAMSLSQVLLDSIGPRLTGTPGSEHASEWVRGMYESWGIESYTESYGTWRGWRRGITHVDLVEPRVRSLEAMMLAWSGGTEGAVEGDVVVPPTGTSAAEFERFLSGVRGKFVLVSAPEPSCRPNSQWEEFGTDASIARLHAERDAARTRWQARIQGLSAADLADRLEVAGAAGIISTRWPNGWGVMRVFSATVESIPTIGMGCEDYGLLARLAEHDQGPRIRVDADAEFLGDVPVFNTLARIEGTELPDEYVLLSAHFDSWDGGSGATDNGTGTITMMEAMRILKETYPAPKRTILVGHWNGEEQGLNGSRAFAADHPEIVEGLQALFNQDNGTGRIVRISMQGLTEAGGFFGRWMSQVPTEIAQHVELMLPGNPGGGGSDYASFICAGAPAFSLGALSWQYSPYTWHTNRDTYDKVVEDDLVNNAVLTAMLAYMAAEDPDRIPRTRRTVAPNPRTGAARTWPTCRDGAREYRVRR